MLFELVQNNYKPTLLKGVDYSPTSIDLSKRIAKSKENGSDNIKFDVMDVLDENQVKEAGEWDLVLDKGTFG